MGHSEFAYQERQRSKMKYYFAILLAFLTSAAFAYEDSTLWIDDKSIQDKYNCDGYVTDAICCQDRICQGQSESSCTSDDKRKLFCAWDSSKSKCLEVRDAKNNVCCQKKPLEGCNDLMKGRCPEQYQVSKECCSDDGKKWNSIFTGVSPGKFVATPLARTLISSNVVNLDGAIRDHTLPTRTHMIMDSDTTHRKNFPSAIYIH